MEPRAFGFQLTGKPEQHAFAAKGRRHHHADRQAVFGPVKRDGHAGRTGDIEHLRERRKRCKCCTIDTDVLGIRMMHAKFRGQGGNRRAKNDVKSLMHGGHKSGLVMDRVERQCVVMRGHFIGGFDGIPRHAVHLTRQDRAAAVVSNNTDAARDIGGDQDPERLMQHLPIAGKRDLLNFVAQ